MNSPVAPSPVGMPPEPPARRWRIALGALSIVLLSGGATAAIALNEVGRLTEALEQNKPVKVAPKVLAPTSDGEPETLLLVGNDERAPPKDNPSAGPVLPHSNEMLLVRIDPSMPTIAMLSIPRELKVPIDKPDGEVEENRINSAFTYGWENGGGTAGGVKLMLETIKQVLGITVNHVFITNFHKFAKAVDAMGCVYMTVDKRYYHVNEPGGEQYFEINLQPGYQRLCGKQALEFVANRHESTSLIRDARDQRFLLEVKAEYGASLFENREKFEDIFGKYVESTLAGEEEILQLLYLLVESAGKPVRQVDLQVSLGPSFDTTTPEQIHEAVSSFFAGTGASHHQTLSVSSHRGPTRHGGAHPEFGLTPTTHAELQEARAQATKLPFALEYPRARDGGGAEPDELRLYDIRDPQGHLHPIYVIVIDRGPLGQYYDVQGTNWSDPPMLQNPGQTVQVGTRTYELFYAGEQVRAIAWHEGGAVYWIENTLTNSVSSHAMLAMAEQTLPVITSHATPAAQAPTTAPAGINLAPRALTRTSMIAKIEALLGLLGLGVVAALFLVMLIHQRELRRLRDAITDALTLEARQAPLLAAGGIVRPASSTAKAAATGMPFGPGLVPTERPLTIYRASRSWRRAVLAAASAAVAAAVIASGAYVLDAALFSSSAAEGSTLRVAVFNATTTPGAAHRIAGVLRSHHVSVGQIGNISASPGPGVYVLYPPGAEEQAGRVARTLSSPSSSVEQIQPKLREAVGGRDEIVVVIG